MLYEECDVCGGTGFLPFPPPGEAPCGCKLLRVFQTGLSVGQAETLARELGRRDLRIRGLETELRELQALLSGGAPETPGAVLTVAAILAWALSASEADRLAVLRRLQFLLSAAGCGRPYIHEYPRPHQAEKDG